MPKDKASKTPKKAAAKAAPAPVPVKAAAPKTFAARAIASENKGQNPPSDGN